MWALYLTGSGFDVDTAFDGAEALNAVRASCPDVIVTDLTLPGLSGLELARTLRGDATTRHVPLIAATGSADQSLLAEARSWFQLVLTKPCDPDELVRQLRRVLAAASAV